VDEENTHNIFIEGENLESLKLLQKSYKNLVDIIYIDPPYNTGEDFIYDDNFTEAAEGYLRKIGDINENGVALSTNPDSSGRFHSNWLNMMYPRLLLAKNVLREDGIFFISIDDHEVQNLKLLLNELFGEENFIAQLVWKKKYTGGKHSSFFVDLHEYILCYAKDKDSISGFSMARPDEEKSKFEYSDEFINERGKYYIRPLKSNLASRPTLVYPITLPDGK